IQDDDALVANLLVDNADGAAHVQLVGVWTSSTAVPGFIGTNYLHDGNIGKGSKSATFVPTIGTSGSYEVFLRYTADTNRASNIPVDIIHAAGTTTVTVNQRSNAAQGVSLGVYNFLVGTAGRVTIRTTGTDGFVIADAIQLQARTSVTAIQLVSQVGNSQGSRPSDTAMNGLPRLSAAQSFSAVLTPTNSPPVEPADHYQQINLVSDLPWVAQVQDTNLVNGWGISFHPG